MRVLSAENAAAGVSVSGFITYFCLRSVYGFASRRDRPDEARLGIAAHRRLGDGGALTHRRARRRGPQKQSGVHIQCTTLPGERSLGEATLSASLATQSSRECCSPRHRASLSRQRHASWKWSAPPTQRW